MKKKLTIKETTAHLRKHASVLLEMPAGEQFIGPRDAVLHSALNQIADALELLESLARPLRLRSVNEPSVER